MKRPRKTRYPFIKDKRTLKRRIEKLASDAERSAQEVDANVSVADPHEAFELMCRTETVMDDLKPLMHYLNEWESRFAEEYAS